MYVLHYVHPWCPCRLEEIMGFLAVVSHHVGHGNGTVSLKEPSVLLTSELSLAFFLLFFRQGVTV